MLGVGIAAGRASARAGGDSITEAELGYEQGGGI
jgi:hypothetical protein